MMTSDLEGEYKQIQTMAEGREVSFADQTFNAGNQSFSLSGLLDFKSLPSGMGMFRFEVYTFNCRYCYKTDMGFIHTQEGAL